MHETPADSNGPDGDGVPGPRIPGAVNRAHGEGWPVGFAAGSANRRAAMILASLPGLTPRRLLGAARASVAQSWRW